METGDKSCRIIVRSDPALAIGNGEATRQRFCCRPLLRISFELRQLTIWNFPTRTKCEMNALHLLR